MAVVAALMAGTPEYLAEDFVVYRLVELLERLVLMAVVTQLLQLVANNLDQAGKGAVAEVGQLPVIELAEDLVASEVVV